MAKVAAVSGYKPFESGIFKQDHPGIPFIKAAIRRNLENLLEEGLEWVMISGQPGIELWAAEVVFELQMEDYPHLQLAVITPFFNQEEKWSDSQKEWYEFILGQADYVDTISKKPYEKPWQFRLKNQFFVEKSDVLLLMYDTEKEGSPRYLYEKALEYQEQQEYQIRLITFYDLQLIVEEEQLKALD